MLHLKTRFFKTALACSLAFSLVLAPAAHAATCTQAISAYSSPGKGKVTAKIAKGDKISLLAKNGKHYKIKTASGKIGYIPMSAVSNTAVNQKSANSSSANSYALTSSGNEDFDLVLDLVNQARAEEGLHPLQFDSRLQKAAHTRAKELVQDFSHFRPDGSSVFSVFDEINLSNVYRAENIADGQATPEEVVASWLKSPGHRKNIMGKDYQYIGIGFHSAEKKWAQLFWGPMS